MTDGQFTKGHLITLLISSAIGVGFGAAWWFFGASSRNWRTRSVDAPTSRYEVRDSA